MESNKEGSARLSWPVGAPRIVSLRLSEEFFGIGAVGMELCEFLNHSRTVGGICHTEPYAVGVKHLYACFARLDQCVDRQRDEEFALGGVYVAVKEPAEFAFAVIEIVGSEAPEIH